MTSKSGIKAIANKLVTARGKSEVAHKMTQRPKMHSVLHPSCANPSGAERVMDMANKPKISPNQS